MARQRTVLPVTLAPRGPGVPAGQWLYDSLRASILDGRLKPGARLPATRDLARQYGLARGTVVAAFDQLQAEGYLRARVGSGTRVAAELPEARLHAPRAAGAPLRPARRLARRLSSYGARVRLFGRVETPVRAFRANQPAADLFPMSLWAQVSGRCLRRASRAMLLGCGPTGYPPLQAAVADYLITSRGVRCLPEQVIIVSGVQDALDVATRLFVDAGDRVAMENPGYVGARLLFEAAGATVVPVPVDGEGLVIDARRLAGARLVYVTPAHQYPLGVSMSLARRLALLEWARRSGAVVFEDDYDSEYRYAGRPLPALQGLDRHGQVVFAGSFSKVLFPALRLGYLVVPPDLVDRVAALVSVSHRHAPVLEQATLADFISAGHFARHVRRMREVYAERLSTLMTEAERRLDGVLQISPIEAGLQTVGRLLNGVSAADAERAAAARGVEVVPNARFSVGRSHPHTLQIGFAAVDPTEIRRGVEQLALALGSLTGRRESVESA